MFPRDTITTYYENTANGTFTVLSTSTRTILSADIINTLGKGTLVELFCGTSPIINNHNNDLSSVQSNYVCTNKPIRITVSAHDAGGEDVVLNYVNRDRQTTPDPTQEYSTTTPVTVGNFPTGFNINNFPALQPVAVNNFPTLQDVNCTLGCDASTTLILSSSTIEVLTTTAPTFQEWMLVVGVFLAINSIHMWNFLFRRPKTVIKANKIYR
jgi:hypothetical protein